MIEMTLVLVYLWPEAMGYRRKVAGFFKLLIFEPPPFCG